MWGCNDTDQRGTIIEKILNNNINILNNGQATRINASTGNLSAIDLSVFSTITPHLEWNTIPELSSSDHFPIKLTLNYTNPDEEHTRSLKWKLTNANWNTYQKDIENNLINYSFSFSNNSNVEDNMEKLNNLIYSTASNIFEQCSYSGKRPPVPWWNKTIKHAIRNKKTTFNKFKRTKDFNNFIEFKKNKALVRYLIKNQKNKSWRKFTADLNSKKSTTNIWKKIKIIKGIPMAPIKTIHSENSILTESHAIAQTIGQYFYSNSIATLH
jgi:hypothetical protein